jgi:hypothetical protein
VSDYEVTQRMMRLAPVKEISPERWAFHLLEQMERAGLDVRVKANDQ